LGAAGGCEVAHPPGNPAPATQPASAPALARHEYAQLHMGVKARIILYAASEEIAAGAARAAYGRVADLEDIASDYRPKSELMRLCDQAGGDPVPVSRDLFIMLRRSIDVSARSEGTFDITCGPYVRLWRQARKDAKLPAPDALREAGGRVGWDKLKLDPAKETAQLLVKGMKLDLGGIAKGYAGDLAIATLKSHGIRHALFEAGGDIVVSDPPPGTDGWRIALVPLNPREEQAIVPLSNCAVSTSGDTEQHIDIDGKRYSHIVDPRTGLGLTSRAAVTVIARSGLIADSLSKACSILGPEKSKALAQADGATVRFRRSE